ncbi:MAG TPA: NUDIX hydrolase [Patescibacteria group bacterium]|nr:NUDIX hydrolase [Patescibacteria group bacterium]
MIQCTFEDNSKAYLRHVVVDTLVLHNDQILLVKRAPRLLEGGKWGLVGGYVEQKETLPEAVAREVKEETGYTLSHISLLAVNANPRRPHEDRQNISFIFTADAEDKKGESDDEVTQEKWFALDSLPPQDEIAFDHYPDIELYLQQKNNPQHLPIVIYTR